MMPAEHLMHTHTELPTNTRIVAEDDATEVITAPFNYEALEVEVRISVQQLAREIRDDLEEIERMGLRTRQRLIAARARLPRRAWGAWLRSEFPQISQDTVENLIHKARLVEQHPKLSELETRFADTALTLLAKPSTPAAVVNEAMQRAEAGEYVGVADAKELVQAAKANNMVAKAERVAKADDRGKQARMDSAAPPASAALLPAATFLAQTEQGPQETAILRQAGELALHLATDGRGAFHINHMPSGRVIPRDFPI